MNVFSFYCDFKKFALLYKRFRNTMKTLLKVVKGKKLVGDSQ